MNVNKLLEDLNNIENEFKGHEQEKSSNEKHKQIIGYENENEEDQGVEQEEGPGEGPGEVFGEGEGQGNGICQEDLLNITTIGESSEHFSLNKSINSYFSIFNTKNEYKKIQMKAEHIQIEIIDNLIFLLKLKSNYDDEKMVKMIFHCINETFQNKNKPILDMSKENPLFIYKQNLLKNKYLFLKVIRKMKNKHFYPDIKQCIKDVTRDVFSFNKNIYNGSLGFENILYILYKLINKNMKDKLKSLLLSFFILSILSRTNNSVDILYILEYFYKNDNYAFVIPDSSFLSPCELSVYKNIIILKSNIKYCLRLSDQTTLSYNCYNIIYINEHDISENFYIYIYSFLLKQEKYHYIFKKKIFRDVDFFNTHLNYLKLKKKNNTHKSSVEEQTRTTHFKSSGIHSCTEILFTNSTKTELNAEQKTNNESQEQRVEREKKNLQTLLNDMEISSESSYDYVDSGISIEQINDQNDLYLTQDSLSAKKKNFFYQFLIIELDQ